MIRIAGTFTLNGSRPLYHKTRLQSEMEFGPVWTFVYIIIMSD